MQDIVQGDLDLDEFFEEMQETGMQVRAVYETAAESSYGGPVD
jgi:hypothetical protein